MFTTRDPETMTADQRRHEVATILAAGLLRRVRQPKTADSDAHQASSPGAEISLDVSPETRLSVGQ